MPEPVAATAEAASPRWLVGAAVGLCALVAIDAGRVLSGFAVRYTDEDQAIFWVAAQEFGHLRFREPMFYGQAYGALVEALPAAVLLRLGLPLNAAVPLATIALGLAPWFIAARRLWILGRRTAALVAAGAPLLLPLPYAMQLALPSFGAGILFAAVGAYAVERRPARAGGRALFAYLAVLGTLLFPNTLLLSAPVALAVVLRRDATARSHLFAAGGAAAGIGTWAAMRGFYALNPAWDLHPAGPRDFRLQRLAEGLLNLDRHWGAVTPAFLRAGWVLVVLLVAGWCGLAVARGARSAAPAGLAIVLAMGSLGLAKVHDGSESVFFSFARMYLALPLVPAFLWAADGALGSPPGQTGVGACGAPAAVLGLRRPAVGAGMALAVAIAIGRQLALPATVSRALATPAWAITPRPVDEVRAGCERIAALAAGRDGALSVHLRDRLAAYACGALLYGRVETLFPGYERRTWRLFEESRTSRTEVLVSEAGPDFCARAVPHVVACEHLPGEPPVARVALRPGGTAIGLLAAVGAPVRRF